LIKGGKKMLRVFQIAELGGYKFAILLDDETMSAYEAVWTENGWETDFNCYALGVDSFDLAGMFDYEDVEKMGYIFIE